MKRNIILAVLLTAAVAFSCTTKEEASKSLNDGSIAYTPKATIEAFILDGAATKTTATISEADGASFTFNADDMLGVFPYDPQSGDQVRFLVKEQDASWATFDGQGFGLKNGQKYAAYYPGDITNAAAGMVEQIPVDYTNQKQTVAGTFSVGEADYLVANGIEPAGGVCEFNMHHVGALAVLDVKFPTGGTFTEVSLNTDGTNKFVTTGTMDLTASAIAVEAETVDSKLALSLGESGIAVADGATVRFFMMVAPVDLTGATVTLTVKDNNNVEQSAAIAAKNFKAGYAYKIACNLGGGETPAEPTNLSENGTANSYIVDVDNINAAGYYFNCTVAGNGQVPLPAGILGAVGCASAYPTSGAAAPTFDCGGVRVILNQNSCVSDVALADGKISFKATGAKGNAKIQLRNSNDDGVWTWLIWCTDQPADVALTNGYTILDRNLGATSNLPGNTEAEYGLYYMFGDPIGYTAENFVNAGSDNAAMVWELAHTPNQPLVGDGCWFNIWTATANPKQVGAFLWGAWGTGAGETWGATFDKQPGTASHKTLYDPCPAGYKVMAYDVLTEGNVAGDLTGVYVPAAEGTVYFPYNGMVHKGGYVYNWAFHGPYDPSEPDGFAWYAAVWTSAHNNSNMAYFKTSYAKGSNRGYVAGLDQSIMSRGMGVRCMKQ